MDDWETKEVECLPTGDVCLEEQCVSRQTLSERYLGDLISGKGDKTRSDL